MGLPHAQPGQLIAVRDQVPGTRALFKTSQVEVIRMVLSQGRSLPEHKAPGEIIVQCLEGRVHFVTMGKTIELESGQMIYLSAGEPHAVNAVEDCCFLLTIILTGK